MGMNLYVILHLIYKRKGWRLKGFRVKHKVIKHLAMSENIFLELTLKQTEGLL